MIGKYSAKFVSFSHFFHIDESTDYWSSSYVLFCNDNHVLPSSPKKKSLTSQGQQDNKDKCFNQIQMNFKKMMIMEFYFMDKMLRNSKLFDMIHSKKMIVNMFVMASGIKFFNSINLEIFCYNLVIIKTNISLLQMQHLKKIHTLANDLHDLMMMML